MTITGAFVLFAVIWSMTMFVVLPLGLRTHGDEGTEDADTPAFTPLNANIKAKVKRTTLITLALWIPLCAVIMSGVIGIEDIDFYGRMDR